MLVSKTPSAATKWIRRGVVGATAFAAGLGALIFTIPSVRNGAALWPGASTINGNAAASQASSIIEGLDGEASLNQARELAQNALVREPLNVEAVRSLGLLTAMEGDNSSARDLFLSAERLTRRDTRTQIWLIEDAARRGALDDALAHHDRSLRASVQSRDMLLPTLVAASANPLIARRLAHILSKRPLWWGFFVDRLLWESSSPEAIATITNSLDLQLDESEYPTLLPRAIARLIELKAYDAAYRLYAHAYDIRREGAKGLTNGRFESPNPLPPFDWRMAEEPTLGAFRSSSTTGEGLALLISSARGRGGEVASQLLLLQPGSYRLSASLGRLEGTPPAAATLRVTCDEGDELARASAPPVSATGSKISVNFRVPPNCNAQWLAIDASSASDDGANESWIDNIRVSRHAE